MKFLLKFFLLLLALFTFGEKSFALTDYQIKKICKKAKGGSACIRDLRLKRHNLQKGILIKIPVIPHKR